MPAPSHRVVRHHANSTGRRLTSLEGGNRGMLARGHRRPLSYGDLSCNYLVRTSKVARYRDTHVPCRVECIPMTPVFLLPARAIKCISTPSARLGHVTVLPMAWICTFLPSSGTGKQGALECSRPDKEHGYPGIVLHCWPVPKSYNSNPHSTTACLDRVASSRGFLPRGS